MGRSFDFLLAGAALIVGILLLTGHGEIFLKGGNTQLRKAKYDEDKMSKGSGVALILIGIMTFIDSYTETGGETYLCRTFDSDHGRSGLLCEA